MKRWLLVGLIFNAVAAQAQSTSLTAQTLNTSQTERLTCLNALIEKGGVKNTVEYMNEQGRHFIYKSNFSTVDGSKGFMYFSEKGLFYCAPVNWTGTNKAKIPFSFTLDGQTFQPYGAGSNNLGDITNKCKSADQVNAGEIEHLLNNQVSYNIQKYAEKKVLENPKIKKNEIKSAVRTACASKSGDYDFDTQINKGVDAGLAAIEAGAVVPPADGSVK